MTRSSRTRESGDAPEGQAREEFNASWQTAVREWRSNWPYASELSLALLLFLPQAVLTAGLLLEDAWPKLILGHACTILLAVSLRFKGPAPPVLEQCKASALEVIRMALEWPDATLRFANNFVVVNVQVRRLFRLWRSATHPLCAQILRSDNGHPSAQFSRLLDWSCTDHKTFQLSGRAIPGGGMHLDDDVRQISYQVADVLQRISDARLHRSAVYTFPARFRTLLIPHKQRQPRDSSCRSNPVPPRPARHGSVTKTRARPRRLDPRAHVDGDPPRSKRAVHRARLVEFRAGRRTGEWGPGGGGRERRDGVARHVPLRLDVQVRLDGERDGASRRRARFRRQLVVTLVLPACSPPYPAGRGLRCTKIEHWDNVRDLAVGCHWSAKFLI